MGPRAPGEQPRSGPDPATGPVTAERRNNIDALRLIAALLVLFAHCFALSEPGLRDPITGALQDVLPLQRGLAGQGVALFFVISGFLVTRSYLSRRNLGAYAASRALRIFPALWVALGLTVVVATAITTLGAADFLTKGTTLGYLAHNGSLLGLRYDLAGVFADNPLRDVNISLWTLPLEFLMYLVVAALGVIGLLRSRALFNVAVGVAALAFVVNSGLPLIEDRHESELLLFFGAGAFVYVNRDLIKLRGRLALPLLGASMLLSLLDFALADVAAIGAFTYFLLWLGFTRSLRLPNLAARGDLSYATYLYAALVTQLWIAALGAVSPWVLLPLTAGVTLPLAWLSWHLVERPALAQKPRAQALVGRLAARAPRGRHGSSPTPAAERA